MYKVLTIVLLLSSHLLLAQPKQLAEYFSQVRKQQSVNIPKEVLHADNAKSVLSELPVYLKDSVDQVRGRAIAIVRAIGIQSKLASVRQQAIALLIEGIKDKNTGNAGVAITYLTEFKQSNFIPGHKDSIRSIFRTKAFRSPQLIKLVGFFEMMELQSELLALSQSRTEGKVERWSALLALARMGDEQAISNIMNRLQRIPVSDDVVYQLFPDLVYTRARPVLNYLIEALNSDAKNCHTANEEKDASIPCGYRIMEMIAPAIKDYPLKLDESGDVVTTDYVVALQTVRTWLKGNGEYEILRDKF